MCDISIIVPVYNAGSFICECINSILSQSLTNYELLLIDDGSIDNSGFLCDQYACADSRVRVFHQSNKGVSCARNYGIQMAQGEWIAFVDADDLLPAEALNNLFKAANNVEETDLVMASSDVLINGCISPLYTYNYKQSRNVIQNIGHAALWGYLFRGEIIRKYNISFVPGLAYSEDFVFLAETALHCRYLCVIPESVYIYRRNNFSACAAKDGLNKAKHQFHAAFELKRIGEKCNDKVIKDFLYCKQKKILKMGYMSYVSNSFLFSNYSQYENLYLNYFDKKVTLLYHTIVAYLIYLRREYFRVFDNKLTGEIGLLTKIKNIF